MAPLYPDFNQCTPLPRMAPEILENWKVPNGSEGSPYLYSADVFSATVVVWECLSARIPYEEASDPVKGYKLLGAVLGDHIVAGLRPSSGAIPDGCGGFVSERMQVLVESGWHLQPTMRPTAEGIAVVLEEEVIKCAVGQQLVSTEQECEVLSIQHVDDKGAIVGNQASTYTPLLRDVF